MIAISRRPMGRIWGVTLVLVAAFAVTDAMGKPVRPPRVENAGADEKSDKAKVQGEWVVVSMEAAGIQINLPEDAKLVVKDDEWTPPQSAAFKLTFKIDAAKSPKQLDLNSSSGKATWLGIYKLEGDTFVFCRRTGPGGERPTDFKGGPGVFLIVCKRAGK